MSHPNRQVRLRDAMKAAGLDALLCFQPENSFYLSNGVNAGIYSHEVIGVVTPNDLTPTIVLNTLRLTKAEQTPGDRKIYNYQTWHGRPSYGETWQDALARALSDANIGSAPKIGIETGIKVYQKDGVRALYPDAEFIPATDIIDACRTLKDDDEIKKMRMAAAIANVGMSACIKALNEGLLVPEAQLEAKIAMHRHKIAHYPDAEIMGFGSSEGAKFDTLDCWALAGDERFKQAATPSARPAVNEAVSALFWAAIDGYHAELERTVHVGAVAPLELEIVKAVRAYRKEIVPLAKPGVPVNELYRRVCELYNADGYKPPNRIGHSIGAGPHEHFSINATNDTPLAVGMVLAIEPGINFPGKAKTQISDTFVITEQGCEFLCRYDDDETCDY